MWKFNFKMSRDRWLLVLAAGICLMILALPSGSRGAQKIQDHDGVLASQGTGKREKPYEQQLEDRVKKLLSTVEGVGKVDVMIVLSSSEERILKTDSSQSSSETQEEDPDGGTRRAVSREQSETTVMTGSGTDTAPVVEKEIMPQIQGIVVSAQGGGNAVIKEEISAALEALFHVPRHKIRVLKRVE